jgi:glutamate-1-semialdehyde 2,1-aminomutase
MGRMTIQEQYRASHPRSAALADRARNAIPGGITHDIRHLAPFPTYIDRASGTRKWDVDGHEYVDYWMGHGALFLGHCHPAVVKAVQEQVARGTHLGASHELEVRWAELVNGLVPCAELTRFTMSGTEATHLAMRVARAATGRTRILKFAGHFHGWHDGAVAAVNPPYEVPMSAGIPGATLDQVVICPPNDIKAVEIALQRGDIAAVILEPAGGQSGTTPTIPGYLQELRALTTKHGVVLIFDEVITGFRVAYGGAQELYGVRADLTCLGKIIGGGLPVGAYGGSRKVMGEVAPLGGVYQAGTLSGNPLAVAAGLAAIRALTDRKAYARLETLGAALEQGLRDGARRANLPLTVNRVGSMLTAFFCAGPVRDYASARTADTARYGRFFQAMLERGVYLAPSQFEAAFVSLAHSDADLAIAAAAAAEAFAAAV